MQSVGVCFIGGSMNSRIIENYDWSKYNSKTQARRSNMELIAATVIKGGEIVSTPSRQRFVWPRSFEESNSRILSRRVWGQAK